MRAASRQPTGLIGLAAIGLTVVVLAGCSGSAASQPGIAASQPVPGSPVSASTGPARTGPARTGPARTGPARTGRAALAAGPAEPKTQAGARAAAVRFYRLQTARQFAASWHLLAAAARQQIRLGTWVRVHEGCRPAGAGAAATIGRITVFGSAAIVTSTVVTGTIGASGKGEAGGGRAEAVFSYAAGHWRYSPSDLGIYHHGTVAADIAAARTAGFCTGPKTLLLGRRTGRSARSSGV